MEGQMDIFEAMNRAAEAVDRMVAQENKAKKNAPAEKSKEQADGQKRLKGKSLHASLHRSYINTADDDFATVAYIDYNMVYWKNWNSPASLRRFDTAKEAVDFYVDTLNDLQKQTYASQITEHEPFSDLIQTEEGLYVEEG